MLSLCFDEDSFLFMSMVLFPLRCSMGCTFSSPSSLYASCFVSAPNLQGKWPQEVISLGEVVGKLSADAAARLGLREGIPVAQGGADAFVGMGKITRIPLNRVRRDEHLLL